VHRSLREEREDGTANGASASTVPAVTAVAVVHAAASAAAVFCEPDVVSVAHVVCLLVQRAMHASCESVIAVGVVVGNVVVVGVAVGVVVSLVAVGSVVIRVSGSFHSIAPVSFLVLVVSISDIDRSLP
jgi:hypothetical protein